MSCHCCAYIPVCCKHGCLPLMCVPILQEREQRQATLVVRRISAECHSHLFAVVLIDFFHTQRLLAAYGVNCEVGGVSLVTVVPMDKCVAIMDFCFSCVISFFRKQSNNRPLLLRCISVLAATATYLHSYWYAASQISQRCLLAAYWVNCKVRGVRVVTKLPIHTLVASMGVCLSCVFLFSRNGSNGRPLLLLGVSVLNATATCLQSSS